MQACGCKRLILKKLLFAGSRKGEGGFVFKINNMREPRAAFLQAGKAFSQENFRKVSGLDTAT
jgi:hypothetical protein